MPKVLIVEDDVRLARVIDDWLTGESYAVDHVVSGPAALEKLKAVQYDVLILDWQVPGLTGLEVCKEYRANGGAGVVLMLTGKKEIANKEEGLDSGADDYVTKPFHMRELSARLRALMRRSREIKTNVIKIGDLELDSVSHVVTKADKELQLMPREYALLEFFMRNPGKVFSADNILDKVWSNYSEASPDTVRVHITKLRSKIDIEGQESLIKTLHRVGYKFEKPAGMGETDAAPEDPNAPVGDLPDDA